MMKLTQCLTLFAVTASIAYPAELEWWLTAPDPAHRLAFQGSLESSNEPIQASIPRITVDRAAVHQSIDGFGFALTGGSAQMLIGMSPENRRALIRELFTPDSDGISISYLRLSIGASDLNQRVFSYDDMPPGETDFALEHFDLQDDRADVLPVLAEILAVNPRLTILASPWSAPPWMKTNGRVQGGRLRDECYPVYAAYFVKYIQAMAREGVIIDAVTIQNEPFNDGNTPSMQFFAKDEARFIRDHLGPALRQAKLSTKIILYDHNCDAPEYPISILTDAETAQYVDGSGFHLYAGPITALSVVHDRFPDKHIYFTEYMAVNRREFDPATPVSRIVVGAMRNWSRNVILWNLAANSQFEPHTDNGGCTMCQGAVTIDGDRVQRNLAYYVIGHASKFVPPGSVRIGSSGDSLSSVAFRTPTGRTVVIVSNPAATATRFSLIADKEIFQPELPAKSVATFVW